MHRRFMTCRPSTKGRASPPDLSSQSRYLVLRLHPYLGDLRFYIALNTINLLNLHTDEEAMHRQFATRRTSVKRQSRGFTTSQLRYLKTQVHPYLGDLRFHKTVKPKKIYSTYILMMHRRLMTCRHPSNAPRRHRNVFTCCQSRYL